MLKISVLFAMIITMTLSACSSVSIGTRVGEIKIKGKNEQPKVIVNSDEKTSAKYLSTDRSDIQHLITHHQN